MPNGNDEFSQYKVSKTDEFSQYKVQKPAAPAPTAPVPTAGPAPTQYTHSITGQAIPPGTRLNPRTGLPMISGDPTGKTTLAGLPYVGGALGGALAGPVGATLGGIGGKGLEELMKPLTKQPMSANPPLEMLKAGGEQGAYELGGQAISWVGGKLMPSVIKRAMSTILEGRLDRAGQSIDRYLMQPHINATTADYATPLNNYLDEKIALATRGGDTRLAKALTKLKTTWATNYNLSTATPMEATKFVRDIGKLTSFGTISEKATVNQIKKEVIGGVSSVIRDNVFGLEELNAKYAGISSAQKAITSATSKAMKGYPGAFTGIVGSGIQSFGEKFPNLMRALVSLYSSDKEMRGTN